MTAAPGITRREEILDRLRPIAATLLDTDVASIDVDRSFLELGADSLTLMDASRAVQDNFGVTLSMRLLVEEISTLSNLAAYIDEAMPVKAAAPASAAPIPAPRAVERVVAPAPKIVPPPPMPMPVIQPLPRSSEPTTTGGLERIVTQQLQLLAQQLDQQSRIISQQLSLLSGSQAPVPEAEREQVPRSARDDSETATAPVPQPEQIPRSARDDSAARRSPAEAFVPYKPISPGSASGLTPQQQTYLDAFTTRYVARTVKSKEYARRFRGVFAENRGSAGFQMATKELLYPIVAERSAGSRFHDLDGNEYIDLAMGFGVFLFGHSPDFVHRALAMQMTKGFQIGPQSDLAGQVAERISSMTGLDRVAFCNTGTEAVMVALRIARTATGRSKVVVFSGAFHGSYDVTLVRSRKVNGEERAMPVAPGIPRSMADDVIVLDYDRPESLDIIRARAGEIAAVLVEPVQSRRPELQPKEFLRELRRITSETGAALIFDEIITGFRAHPRGAQGWFGVDADMALYGKVVAGGLPIGVVAGTARFMDSYDGGAWNYGDASYPRGLTSFFAGTFSKHPLAMAATLAVLDEMTRLGPELHEGLNRNTQRLVDALNAFFIAEDLPIRMTHFASLFRFSSATNLDLLFYRMAEKGIYTWEGRTCFLSTAHTAADIDAVVRAVQESALELRAAGFFPPPAVAKPVVSPKSNGKRTKDVAFSLYYFGTYASGFDDGKYDLLFEGARFADEHGFEAVWVPERHFHAFGGLSPNPSVLAAALARETKRVQLRAGSVVLPLHHPMRVAEEWSVVDNISKGRVAISFASGWHSNDFVFAPDAYGKHRELMFEQIETVRRLWRGEPLEAPGGGGNRVRVSLFPMPKQPELPIWVTVVNSTETYTRAGAIGANILTNLMEQTVEELAANLALYRAARQEHGHDPDGGRVTVLMHTFIGDDLATARRQAEAPFCAYLKSFLGLTRTWVKKQGFAIDLDSISPADLDYLLATSYKRYSQSTALIGTPETCAPIVEQMMSIGVTEIACFVDFGVDPQLVGRSFKHVDALRRMFDKPVPPIEDTSKPVRTVPLTEGQQGFWLFSQLSEQASSASAESMVLRLKGPFQMPAMRSAMQQIVDRHEAMRTTIDPGGEKQYVWAPRPIDVHVVDFTDLPEREREAAVDQWLTDQKEPAFDLVRGPLWHCYVLRVSDDDHLLVLTIHHLVVDGWSLALICRELSELYPAACRGVAKALPAPMQYHEYAAWEERERTTPARAASEAYWKGQYADAIPLMDLPADHARPGVATYRGAREHRRVDDDLYAALKVVSKQHGSTLYMTMLAVFSVFLRRITGENDLVIGSPSVRRSLLGSAEMIGFSLNMLAIRITIDGDPTFLEHLARVKKTTYDSFEHGDCPIGVTSRNLNLPRDPSRPLFATVQFNLNPRIAFDRLGDLTADLVARPISFTPFDLFLDAMEINGELRLDFLYNTGLFEPATMARWMDELNVLMRSVVANPAERISALDMLTPAERHAALDVWNATDRAYPSERCIHELFEAQVERTPDAVAVTFESQQLTYAELNRRANQLAHHLQKLGVGAETLVGVCVERSLDMVIALLGVLKAGGAYVPLDPAYPRDRLEYMIGDAALGVLLTQRVLAERLPENRATVVCVDDEPALRRRSSKNLQGAATSRNAAVVIYTSGSTGRPKGVIVSHQGVVNVLSWARRELALTANDVLLGVTSPSFDISEVELFAPLAAGARLHIASREVVSDGIALLRTLTESGATVMQATPATWHMLVDAGWTATSPGRDRFTVVSVGEALSRELADKLCARARIVWNLYGPTETTIYSTGGLVAASGLVTIGRPLDNTQIYIVDRFMQPVGIGIPGEILIGGHGVARGYLNRAELTAQRFIADPFGTDPDARLYRTGDLARFQADGSIEFLGRLDDQVKVRGVRIELGEIEAVLAEHAGVRQAVVVARDFGPNDKHLDAYVVAQPGGDEQVPRSAREDNLRDELRALARRTLPEHMIPSAFTFLDRLPLTPNGKVNRRALPDPQRDRAPSAPAFVAPSRPMEQVIAGIWSDVLDVRPIGIHDHFFELGGHSLQGTRVVARLRELFAIELSLTSLFQAPTVAAMTVLVEAQQRAQRTGNGHVAVAAPPSIRRRTEQDGSAPLSYAQQRLWFVNQLEPDNPVYNLANALHLRGPLNVDALERSVGEIVRRHESLRTRFTSLEGVPSQTIDADAAVAVQRVDLRGEAASTVQQWIADESRRPFDLARGPLLRVGLLELGDDDHVLTFAVHHIASDGWSNSVFAAELAAIYAAYSAGAPSPLAPLPIQYADYAHWQREQLQGDALEAQLGYWLRQLADAPPVLELAADHVRPAVRRYHGAYHTFTVPKPLAEQLKSLGREGDATLFMVLLAAFQTLLHRDTERDDIVVGSPVANRNRLETEGLIGVFINTLVLRTTLAGGPTFRELLARVRQTSLDALAHQDLPFELLVEKLEPDRSLSYSPVFQVMFVMQNTPPAAVSLAGLTLEQMDVERTTAKFDLTLSIEEGPNGLAAGLQYDTDLFEPATIARMAERFQRLIGELLARPDVPIDVLHTLPEKERRQLLVAWNDTAEASSPVMVHQSFEARVERTPEACALVFENERLDYRELNRRANQVAHRLLALGAGPETCVGLYVERSLESIVGLLGILKAGAAYVPIDPAYPRDRVAFILEDAGVSILLAHRELVGDVGIGHARILYLDPTFAEFANERETNPSAAVTPDKLAYVIYTSGSTGQPKGVAVEHRQLANYVHGVIERLELPAAARYAMVTTIAADLGHTMLFPALVIGGTLHVVSRECASDPEAFADYMAQHEIDCLKIVPSHLAMLLGGRSPDRVFPRQRLVLGGEASEVAWVDGLLERAGDCRIYNHYGPTETTVGVLTCRAERGRASGARQTLPIGRPLPNTRVYVLDRHLAPSAIGVPGELYIGGAGVARGYLNRPDISGQRFVQSPFGPAGERLYRTGDIVRYLPDGNIEFIGRGDRQIKLRGYRVELAEIESALAAHTDVAQVAVLAWYEHDATRVTRLAAYVVAAADASPTVDTLRRFLADKLPDYMLPSSWTFLTELPLTANGKLDRRALPEPDGSRPQLEREYVAPETALEQVLAAMWSEVLDVDRVGIQDNFFELGGHSLMATQVMARVYKVFQVELPLRRLFETPSVAGLRDALLEIPGEAEHIEETARLLIQLSALSDDELETQLAASAER